MHQKRICNLLVAGLLVLAVQVSSAQVAAPIVPPVVPLAAAPAPNLTLRDMAQLVHEAEVRKLRDAQKEAALAEKKAVQPSLDVISVQAKPQKPKKRPNIPEGLQVRAIFGVAPVTYVRFYTSSGEFHDRLVGQSVQDWRLVRIADGIVTMQKGKTLYPIALQMRSAQSLDQEASQPVGNMGNAVLSGPLPDPRMLGVAK